MIGIFCNDPGAAQLISHYVIKNPNNYIFCITGPAKKIFNSNMITYKNFSSTKLFKKCIKIIIGGSWKKNYMINILLNAKKNEIKTILYFDHWGENDSCLKLKNGRLIFPNEIWVCDKFALKKAEKIFKESKIIIKNNFYLESMKKLIKKFIIKESNIKKVFNILYICEPLDDHFKMDYYKNKENYQYTEKNAINFFFKNIYKINKKIDSICFRPHPSENINKYQWVKKMYSKKFKISIFKDNNLINQIMDSSCVVGCNSFPLVLGVIAKKRVISNIPLKDAKCVLPYREIENLNQLI